MCIWDIYKCYQTLKVRVIQRLCDKSVFTYLGTLKFDRGRVSKKNWTMCDIIFGLSLTWFRSIPFSCFPQPDNTVIQFNRKISKLENDLLKPLNIGTLLSH